MHDLAKPQVPKPAPPSQFQHSQSRLSRLHTAATMPVDGASMTVFRFFFGIVMATATIRFALKGWVSELYVDPIWHFSYFGMDWLRPWDNPTAVHFHFLLIGLSAVGIALGLWWRWSTAVFLVTFTAVELWDKATYLNHYVLVSLLAAALCWMPLSRAQLSLRGLWMDDTGETGNTLRRGRTVPAWCVWFVRIQLALVYLFAGVAKIQPDWLIDAQPLATWLPARADLPVLGGLLSQPWTPLVWSWAGMLFDVTIAVWLFWRRTRRWAYVAVVGFHLVTASLFNIGLFPWLMMALTPVFFSPSWPHVARAWLRRQSVQSAHRPPAVPQQLPGPRRPHRSERWLLPGLALWLALQVFVPLRHHLLPGDMRWHEAGFRFAWHVMIIEKNGSAVFHVETNQGRFRIHPREELTALQRRQMSTQPDMVLQYARRLRDRYIAQGHRDVRVRVDAHAALNGRRSQRLIDPTIDLAAVRSCWGERTWVVPLMERP